MRRTKIVCTLGPASLHEDMLEKMLKNGMNVARLNFSHGTHEYHKKSIELFRRVRDRLGLPAAIMLDTKGPEIRVGDFENGRAELVTGSEFTLTTRDILGKSDDVTLNDEQLCEIIRDNPAGQDDQCTPFILIRKWQQVITKHSKKQFFWLKN